MRQLLITILAITFITTKVVSQGPIKNLRYEDDFSFLISDTNKRKGLNKLKLIPLSKKDSSFHISFGGELREWYEYRNNPNFGDLPPEYVTPKNGILLHRSMVHSDLVLGKRFRLFTQLNSTFSFFDNNALIPEITQDGIGLHQAFFGLALGNKNNRKQHQLQVGRQELSFGNELLVSSREGPNNRLAFDGAQYIYSGKKTHVNLFAVSPVIINPKAFDNSHINEYMWGSYFTTSLKKDHHIDYYYFGFYSERKQYNYIVGKQHRHTVGGRFWKHSKTWHYDIELMYQTGQFNQLVINAAYLTGDVKYTFDKVKLKPTVGLNASYITGDFNSSDQQLNTFDAMYPKPIFGLALPQGPSNISHVKPTIGFQPLKRLFINLSWYWLFKVSNNDGSYTTDMIQVRPLPNQESSALELGHQYALDIIYPFHKNLTFITFLAYVTPGEHPKNIGNGLNTFFLGSALQFKF